MSAVVTRREEVLLIKLGYRAARMVGSLSAQGLSMLAWSYARLDFESPHLLQALPAAAKAKARR